ncbi:MAG: hypothetical protein COZ37_02195 [bacterium (Candidatus Ratteibacteria) CG_4_10_14_3_um_filter_41_18]|uniref:Polymerase beta nucleotidyltransferase domain-containing protein n=4 Tax=Candidatus Ratteibacteria TaxID=2979319 RepID=A0A2M7YEM2_9BACT|nr:MAG: hypothetical protein COS11_03380 [bacterium (Candidatus Ratteibacteria) CG01_land_8_20_14_3_00_40_19]PIW74168.1 MAG: hypothetical protein CO004_02125 [bacterium (Candidatus Ratteibacteria) CG_4_8_14_3_um_filter_41_36]PIX77537.1 MAG: hypothetical protein COZ37_02195 [bacterium (Candidatus Ratteibacteria) CG_4_10_14_3_um_filter_41_18]PJA61417.1 MAG: hypothetical protein CO162_06425 [bacterium (Candidatus Ratteibacteria) CG_4_9_14_3_um_filter_41_21]HCG77316.1 hypothetical protein [bacteriu
MVSDQETISSWRMKAIKEKMLLKESRERAKKIAKKCALHLAKKYRIKKAYLIGSSVGMSTFHHYSDIDLLIVGLKPELYFRALAEIYRFLPKGSELDLIPWEDAHEEIKERATTEGEILYEKPL